MRCATPVKHSTALNRMFHPTYRYVIFGDQQPWRGYMRSTECDSGNLCRQYSVSLHDPDEIGKIIENDISRYDVRSVQSEAGQLS